MDKRKISLDDALKLLLDDDVDDIDVCVNVISLSYIMFRVLRHDGTEAGHFRDVLEAIAHEEKLHRRGQVVVTWTNE